MYQSIPSAWLLVSATLLAALGQPRPAAARRAAPNIRGSYFGHFQSTGGDFWTSDLTLTIQANRKVSGQVNVAAIIRGASVMGTVSPSQQFHLTARSVRGQRPMKMMLKGRAMLDPDTERITLTGNYSATGAVREKGTFTLVGAGQGEPGP